MRKSFLTAALIVAQTSAALAGGYLTNTNQSVLFLRNPARDAAINIDGAYFNPAGIGFLSNGWHMAFNMQSAFQTRCLRSAFGAPAGNADGPFGLGTVNGKKNDISGFKHFDGKAVAPVIPSLDLARVGDKWFASFHFGIIGGGGKCKFEEGLPSFESQVAMIPAIVNAIAPGAVTGYSMDTYMQGRQYYFGGQLGVGYKITDGLNVSVGGRLIYADCNYYGYVRNIGVDVQTPGGIINMPASDFFKSQNLPHFAEVAGDRELNCDQTGWGFAPVIGVDYKFGSWNLAAKYEFKTRLRLKNRSGVNTSGLGEYDDGKKIPGDMPALLALGAQYELTKDFRANVGFHYYFDKQASQYESKEEHLKSGGWEVLAGMEYNVNDRWTVSAGWQSTNYGLGENSRFITDMSFVTNSNSIGLGAAFQLKPRVRLNVAYFKTFYKHYRKDMADYCDLKQNFSGMLGTMGGSLTAASEQLLGIINNPNATEAQKIVAGEQLRVVQNELGALGIASQGLSNYPTGGFDNFHRTNDVIGLGIEIDF